MTDMVVDEMDFYENMEAETGDTVSAPVLDNEDNESKVSKEDKLSEESSEVASYTLDIDDDFEFEDDDEDSEDVSFSPEERLYDMADSLLGACLGNKSINQYATDTLSVLRSPSIFRNENYIIFSVFYQFRGKLRRIKIDEEFLKLYLNRNRKMLTQSRAYIDINAYGEIDGSVELGYISGVLKHYRRITGLPDMTEVEFNTLYEKYMIEFKALETNKAYQQSMLILSEGVKLGNKYYFGADDSVSYFNSRMAEIEGLVNIDEGGGFVTSKELVFGEKDVNKSFLVGDFGKITTLNKIYGGIYTGNMYSVVAPPKAGKSKWGTRLAHNVVVEHGNNITVWAPEGGVNKWFAQFRAIHFDYIYNTGVSLSDRKFGVDQDCILNDKFETEELRQLELSSKFDIATNENYGNIDFIDKPFEVDTFLDYVDMSIKRNKSVFLLIDYLQLIGDSDDVSKAYISMLKYIEKNNIAGFFPAQYKQESFDKLVESKSTENIDLRTSGAKSAEVMRTPDVLYALWASTQDLANGTAKLLSMPTRFAKPFPEINLNLDLGTCQFIEVGGE